jgi:hypothetical protein
MRDDPSSPTQVQRHESSAVFLARAERFLLRDEAANNLLLGIAGSLQRHASRTLAGAAGAAGAAGRGTESQADAPYLATVETEGRVVAALSQLILASGRRHCFLFTDLANPTSNHTYQAIGYRPVCDVDDYAFAPRDETRSA